MPNYVNIKYVQHNNDVTVHAIETGWLRIINNETEVK